MAGKESVTTLNYNYTVLYNSHVRKSWFSAKLAQGVDWQPFFKLSLTYDGTNTHPDETLMPGYKLVVPQIIY